MLTTYLHPGGPEGYVWKDPARFQEPGWGGELGQVLRAVSPTAQGTIGGQLRRVAGQKFRRRTKTEVKKSLRIDLWPMVVAGFYCRWCCVVLVRFSYESGFHFELVWEWARVKKDSGGVETRFLGVFGRKDFAEENCFGRSNLVVYNSNKKIHSFIKLGTNFTIFYVKLLLCFS